MAKTKPENSEGQASAAVNQDPLAELSAAVNSSQSQATSESGDGDLGNSQAEIAAANAAATAANAEAAAADQGQAAAAQPAGATSELDVLSAVRELGFENVTDHNDAVRRLIEAQRQAVERERQIAPLVQYGREYAELASDPAFQQFYAQRQAIPAPVRGAQVGQQSPPSPTTQPAQSQPAQDWCPIPQVDLALINRFLETTSDPATGRQQTALKPTTPAGIRNAYDSYVQGVEQFTTELTTNPRAVFNRYRDAEVLPMVRQMIQQELTNANLQQRQQSLSERIGQENPWLFVIDARTGQPAIDPRTGQYVLSAEGQRANQLVEQLVPMIQDPEQAWNFARSQTIAENPELARRIFLNQGQQPQPAAPAQAQQPATPSPQQARNRQRDYLSQAAAASSTPANRDGSLTKPGTTKQKNGRRLTPGHDLLERLNDMGIPADEIPV